MRGSAESKPELLLQLIDRRDARGERGLFDQEYGDAVADRVAEAAALGDERVAFEAVRQHFTGKALTDLTLAVTTINAWNRLAIAFRAPAGSYTRQPVPA